MNCQRCSAEFISTNTLRKWCSRYCAQKAYKERNPERVQTRQRANDKRYRLEHRYKRQKRAPENIAYHAAKQRCTNPKVQNYSDYGGRGIEFRFSSFDEFINHI